MAKYTNIAPGPRGGYHKGSLVMVEAGEVAELDDAPADWFAPVEAGEEPKAKRGRAVKAKDEESED